MSNQPKMHDYSSSKHGGAIGKKTITIKLKRRGDQGAVASETKTVTIKRVAGAPDCRFDSWDPPWNLWEIKPVKDEYADDEAVYCMICVKNVGETAGAGSIKVKDLDTGSTVATSTTSTLYPGDRWKTSGSHSYVGKMPNRDWRLEFNVTP